MEFRDTNFRDKNDIKQGLIIIKGNKHLLKATKIRILSWNVNGIRAAYKKGFLDWFLNEKPDILCLQEIKAHTEQVPEDIKKMAGYYAYFAPAERKGYSGVGVLTRHEPLGIKKGFGRAEFDNEGRTLIMDYGKFILFIMKAVTTHGGIIRAEYGREISAGGSITFLSARIYKSI